MDTGLHSLVAIARFHQITAEVDQLHHEFGSPDQLFSDIEILPAAKALTLKAKHLRLSITDVKNAMLPAIAKTNDGNYIILVKLSDDNSKPESGRVHSMHHN